MRTLPAKSRELGCDMALARTLWASGRYGARTPAAMVADPDRLTPEEIDALAGDFDSRAICDTVAVRLFDRSPHARDRFNTWADDPASWFEISGGPALTGREGRVRPLSTLFGDLQIGTAAAMSWLTRRFAVCQPGRSFPAANVIVSRRTLFRRDAARIAPQFGTLLNHVP